MNGTKSRARVISLVRPARTSHFCSSRRVHPLGYIAEILASFAVFKCAINILMRFLSRIETAICLRKLSVKRITLFRFTRFFLPTLRILTFKQSLKLNFQPSDARFKLRKEYRKKMRFFFSIYYQIKLQTLTNYRR